MAAKGGEIEPEYIVRGIVRAQALMWIIQGGTICAVAALKRPDPTYRAGVFKKAGSTDDESEFTFELGYIFVEEAARGQGLASSLVAQALNTAGDQPVYATTRSDNAPMQNILIAHKFAKSGTSYKSRRTNSMLSLYTCWGAPGHSRARLS